MVRISETQQLSEFLETFPKVLFEWKASIVLVWTVKKASK